MKPWSCQHGCCSGESDGSCWYQQCVNSKTGVCTHLDAALFNSDCVTLTQCMRQSDEKLTVSHEKKSKPEALKAILCCRWALTSKVKLEMYWYQLVKFWFRCCCWWILSSFGSDCQTGGWLLYLCAISLPPNFKAVDLNGIFWEWRSSTQLQPESELHFSACLVNCLEPERPE